MKTVKAPKARQLPSGQWFCRVRIDGKDIPITRDTRDAAERDALAVKMGILQAKQNVNLTLSEAIDQYIEDRANLLSPATIRGYRTIQKNRLQTIMNRPVSKLNTQSVQRAINADAADVSAKTLKNTIGLLSAVLNCHNIELGRLTLPEPPKKQKQIYTKEQLGKLLEAVTGADIEIPVLLAAWLGLRRSEIAGLRWDAIDFDSRHPGSQRGHRSGRAS